MTECDACYRLNCGNRWYNFRKYCPEHHPDKCNVVGCYRYREVFMIKRSCGNRLCFEDDEYVDCYCRYHGCRKCGGVKNDRDYYCRKCMGHCSYPGCGGYPKIYGGPCVSHECEVRRCLSVVEVESRWCEAHRH
jgi:hypothetical protein